MTDPKQISHFHKLKHKWSKKHAAIQQKLWQQHKDSLQWVSENLPTKQLVAGTLSGLLLLSSPASQPLLSAGAQVVGQNRPQAVDKSKELIDSLSQIVPKEMRPLTPEEEQKIGEILSKDFDMKASAELDGKRLNRSYGYIGAEQHLYRYPGDTLGAQFDTVEEANLYAKSGIAPGLGAWGHFAPSKEQFTEKDNQREKYYLAVQTFLVPDYNLRVSEYRDFFRFRKMLVVNPENGKAVVAVIGDAGPAEWTGKHLGGSPEVMHYLERVDGAQKGPVLYFFIDDPNDTIPLGPLRIQ